MSSSSRYVGCDEIAPIMWDMEIVRRSCTTQHSYKFESVCYTHDIGRSAFMTKLKKNLKRKDNVLLENNIKDKLVMSMVSPDKKNEEHNK